MHGEDGEMMGEEWVMGKCDLMEPERTYKLEEFRVQSVSFLPEDRSITVHSPLAKLSL